MSISRPKRWPVRYPVQLLSREFYEECVALNASPGGLAVEASRPLPPETIIYVRLVVPERMTSIDFQVCRVNWCLGNRIGLKAIDMDPREEERLLNILMSRKACPSSEEAPTAPAVTDQILVAHLGDLVSVGLRLLSERPTLKRAV